MQSLNWRIHPLFSQQMARKIAALERSNGGVAADVTLFLQSVWRSLVCSDQSDSMLNVATEGERGSSGFPGSLNRC